MGGDADDADSLENNIDSGANLFSDPKSGRRLKSRLSKTLMFQSSSGFDKNCMLTIEEPIDETVEEDDNYGEEYDDEYGEYDEEEEVVVEGEAAAEEGSEDVEGVLAQNKLTS